jgi:hypothetical protein
MPAIFYGYSSPIAISGPRITPAFGPQWDRAEVTLLCTGDAKERGGYARNDPFPGVTGFYIDSDPATEPVANNKYTVSLSGRGAVKQRVYSGMDSVAQSEMHSNIVIGGTAYNAAAPAWPAADILLNSDSFRQTIVGATSLYGSVGSKYDSPAVGSFPPTPDNPFTDISEPRLNFPWGWVLVRRPAEPLLDGPFSSAGPWLVTYEYTYRHKYLPST